MTGEGEDRARKGVDYRILAPALKMEGGEERVKASYRDNYECLAAIKNTYDPANFFRVNQNIKPSR
jgi:FAD/FMN-containing dehydrogenase